MKPINRRPIASQTTCCGRRGPLVAAVVVVVVVATTLVSAQTAPAAAGSQVLNGTAAPSAGPKATLASTTTTSTTTTTTNTTTTSSITTTSTSAPTPEKASSTTSTTTTTTAPPRTSVASEEQINEAKRIIQERLTPSGENRFVMNRPASQAAAGSVDFAPESAEARAADATTQFGLNFIRSLGLGPTENVVISPLSLQNLLNMVLLGASDSSETQRELIQVLGYQSTGLLASLEERLRPHEAMRSVLESIARATQLSLAPDETSHLLNTNAASLDNSTASRAPSELSAHLQTNQPSDLKLAMPLSGQVNFTLANLILTNKELVALNQSYERDLKQFYSVQVEQFSSRPRNSSSFSSSPSTVGANRKPLHQRVNDWVKNVTHNQILDLAKESDLSGDDLAMVLLNAAHFKGRWLHTFSPKATYDRPFLSGGSRQGARELPFMRQKAAFGYADFGLSAQQAEAMASLGGPLRGPSESASSSSASEDAETVLTEDLATNSRSGSAVAINQSSSVGSKADVPQMELSKEEQRRQELTGNLNCSVLMMPFSLNDGQELSMVILLPTKADGLAALEAALTAPALNEIYKSLSEQQVQVELPKFSFESSQDAKELLRRMGLGRVFEQGAQLDRMFQCPKAAEAGGQPNRCRAARVDKVVHKAKITVDEAGAEAAAASLATIAVRNFIRPPTPIFQAEHPFFFVIRHSRSNMPLFMGRVASL